MSEGAFGGVGAVVVGSGSIGRRHARNLRSLGVQRLAMVDPDEARTQPMVDELGVRPYVDLTDALESERPEAALICSPPSLHARQASEALAAGAHVFIEKPVSHSLAEVDGLLGAAQTAGRSVAVGYNMRYQPAVALLRQWISSGELGRPLWARFEMGQYLPDWRPWQDYRESYTARKELGGGIVLDASHEIDLALWLLGEPRELCCMAEKLSDLEMDVEDSATLLLRFRSGARADVHVDCVQRAYSRGIKVAFSEGTAEWAFPANVLSVYRAATKEREERAFEYEPNTMYVEELREFLSGVEAGSRCHEPLLSARRVLEVGLSALEASERKAWVSLA